MIKATCNIKRFTNKQMKGRNICKVYIGVEIPISLEGDSKVTRKEKMSCNFGFIVCKDYEY